MDLFAAASLHGFSLALATVTIAPKLGFASIDIAALSAKLLWATGVLGCSCLLLLSVMSQKHVSLQNSFFDCLWPLLPFYLPSTSTA